MSDEETQLETVDEIMPRSYRDNLLADSDWTQTLDAPVDREAWATYRQALRDLPNHADWPNVDFPDPPT